MDSKQSTIVSLCNDCENESQLNEHMILWEKKMVVCMHFVDNNHESPGLVKNNVARFVIMT